MLTADTGHYTLVLRHVAYHPFEQEVCVAAADTDLGDLPFAPLGISEVTVTAETVTRQADRFVVSIGNTPALAGQDGTELLARAPGVWLGEDGISINGAGGTKVYVDGRELKGSAEENTSYLRSLTAADIARIEVVPLTGAEFAADSPGRCDPHHAPAAPRRRHGRQPAILYDAKQPDSGLYPLGADRHPHRALDTHRIRVGKLHSGCRKPLHGDPRTGRATAALRRQERFEELYKLRARAFLRGIRPYAETHRRFRHRIHGTQHPHADTIAHHTRTNPERQPLPPAHGREYPDRNRQLHLEDRHAGIAVQTDRRLHALHLPRRQQLPYDDLRTREPCATRSTNPPRVPCTTS